MNSVTITFFSNFLLHHQTPFCESMVARIGEGFRFVATEPIPQERLDMGYLNFENVPYAVNSYKDKESYQKAMRLGYESDVVIIGSAPDVFIEKRIAENKMTFRYYERFFKKLRWRFDPRVWWHQYKRNIRYRNNDFYMLCAGAYTAKDCRFIHAFPNKTYKWGYFSEKPQLTYEHFHKLKENNDTIRILWANRFVEWKHPEEVISLAQKLKRDKQSFQIDMLGIGELREKYECIVKEKQLDDVICFSGPFSPQEVLKRMQRSDIFLITSDKNEGWGVVVNEAMSSACAVVACREIGSAPYLIEQGNNGLVYDKRDKNSLYKCVKQLLENKQFRERIQENGLNTIKENWNSEVAAERLLHLIHCLQNGTETGYVSGPCSRD